MDFSETLLDLRQIGSSYRSWILLAQQDISLRYRRSILGPFWISLSLSALCLGLGLLYSKIFHQPLQDFIAFLTCGLLAWTTLSSLVLEGASIILEAEGNLRSVRIAIPVLAARCVFRNMIIFAHNLLVVAIILIIFRRGNLFTAPFFLFGLSIYIPFGLGVAMILGPLGARFRDVPQLAASIVQLMFFITPIFWRPNQLSPKSLVVQLNPFFHMIELIRGPLLGYLPTSTDWIASACFAAALFVLGVIAVASSRNKIFLWL